MNTKQKDKRILKSKTIWKSTNQVAEIVKKIKKQNFGTQKINQKKNYIQEKVVSSLVACIYQKLGKTAQLDKGLHWELEGSQYKPH